MFESKCKPGGGHWTGGNPSVVVPAFAPAGPAGPGAGNGAGVGNDAAVGNNGGPSPWSSPGVVAGAGGVAVILVAALVLLLGRRRSLRADGADGDLTAEQA